MLGLDVGGTKIELAVFDDNVEKVASWRVATPKTTYEEFLQVVIDMVAAADEKYQYQETIGIGLPASLSKDGLSTSSNVPYLNGQRPSLDLPKHLGRPVTVNNDHSNFVYSEANGGAGAGRQYVLGQILGTGVAGGFCVDGVLCRGANALAGEYGHISLPATLQQKYNFPIRNCGCGNRGCFEQYLSGPGLLWMSHHFNNSYESVIELIDAVHAGSPTATNAFDAYLDCLGAYFAYMLFVFDPDVIVLGGGLSNIKELYDRLPMSIEAHLIPGYAVPSIVPPYFGDSSGVRGAAMMGNLQGVSDRG